MSVPPFDLHAQPQPVLALTFMTTFLTSPSAHGEASVRRPENAVTPAPLHERRLDQFAARVKEGPIRVLFVGDSITARWPSLGADTWAKLAPFEAGNFGVGQHCTEHTPWNLTNGSLVGFDPAVVVLPIGTNILARAGCTLGKPIGSGSQLSPDLA